MLSVNALRHESRACELWEPNVENDSQHGGLWLSRLAQLTSVPK